MSTVGDPRRRRSLVHPWTSAASPSPGTHHTSHALPHPAHTHHTTMATQRRGAAAPIPPATDAFERNVQNGKNEAEIAEERGTE